MRIALTLAAVTSLFVAGAAFAEDQTSAPAGPNPDDEIICRTVATATGTRLGRSKECHSKREWDARRQEDREMTEQQQMRDSRGVATPGGGQ